MALSSASLCTSCFSFEVFKIFRLGETAAVDEAGDMGKVVGRLVVFDGRRAHGASNLDGRAGGSYKEHG